MKNDKRIRIIIGHYGSGKTEFSINYGVKLAQEGKKVAIVDLDIVNLYFRSREKAEELKEMGIRIIGSSVAGSALDLPAISPEVSTALQDQSYEAILDIGGDPAGARALGRYYDQLQRQDYDMFFVLNANRPETQTVEKAIEYMREIESSSRAKITGIVSNTHLLKSTSVEDIVRGYDLAKKVSEATNLPIKYITALEELVADLPGEIQSDVFPIKLYMREEWMI